MRRTSTRLPLPRFAVLAGLATAGLLFVMSVLTSGSAPRRVNLTVTNPTPYQVNVEVSGPEERQWLDLGAVDRGRTRTVEELPDRAEPWLFRFSSGGVDGGRAEIPRAALREAGWKLTVPAEVATRLEAAGLRPSAA